MALYSVSCSNTSHDHHNHQEAAGTTTEAVHGATAEFTSAYICPMHCEGSGSREPGKCPSCEMDYVSLDEHLKDGHTH
jgi:hypothetical protein